MTAKELKAELRRMKERHPIVKTVWCSLADYNASTTTVGVEIGSKMHYLHPDTFEAVVTETDAFISAMVADEIAAADAADAEYASWGMAA